MVHASHHPLDLRDPAMMSVLDAVPIASFFAGLDGRVQYLSAALDRLTGARSADILRDGLSSVVHVDDVAQMTARWTAAIAALTTYRDEFRIASADGSSRWVVAQAEPYRESDSTLTGWFGTLTDVHDLHLGADRLSDELDESAANLLSAHRALVRSEERYRVLTDTLPGVTWTATPDGLLDSVGGRPTPTRERPPTSRLGDAWLEIVHPDDRERARERWTAALRTGAPYDVQFRVAMEDGSYRWTLVRGLAQRDADGSIERWIGLNIDIDDQHRADERREQFVRLVENSDDFISIGDLQGNVTYLNQAGLQMLGIASREEARATTMMDYFVADDKPFVESVILPAIAREGRWQGEFRLRHFVTGEPVPVYYNLVSLTDDLGAPSGIATVTRDIRERQRVEAGLRTLAETGAVMFRSLDYEQTLQNVAAAATRNFSSYCIVDMVDEQNRLQLVAFAHRDPALAGILELASIARSTSGNHPVARAVRDGASTLVESVGTNWLAETGIDPGSQDAVRALSARSMLCVPVRTSVDGAVVGALSFIIDRNDARRSYAADDVRFAEEIALRAGLAFDHARAYGREHRIAATLQAASLPKTLPELPGLRLSADYRPGNSEATIGGDWYDAFVLDDGRVVVTMGDVLGNGLNAAVTMGKLRQAMQSVALVLPRLDAMLDVGDRIVRADSERTYATALAGIFDPKTRTFIYASAGHPGPIVRDPLGAIHEFESTGVMLGLRTPGDTRTISLTIAQGSTLVFYTDGLVEATRDLDEGHRRLHAAISDARVAAAGNPAHALVEHVLAGRPPTDDIAVFIANVGTRAAQ